MKLNGIKSSKGRRVAFERNNTNRMPTTELLAGHQPVPQESGALKCTNCSGIYSPAAFARHLTGEAMTDGHAGVYITGNSDPWMQRDEQLKRDALDREATLREAAIDAYWLERKRPKNRTAHGIEKHPFFD